MSKVIIFKNDDGGVSIVTPSPKTLAKYTIEQVADKDVPAGKPYAIVDKSGLPTGQAFFNAWTVDEADLSDGVGSGSNEFPRGN